LPSGCAGNQRINAKIDAIGWQALRN